MIKFYFSGAPNPLKVALFLEEAGLDYEPIPIDTRKGEQHADSFRALNPNGKVPVIVDGDATVFDSNAILLYLADKTGQFLPAASDANRGQMLSWLMFVATGLGPFSGQSVHFRHHAPETLDYAVNRYTFEAKRHLSILDDHLKGHQFMIDNTYSIVDMDVWGWARMAPFVLGDDAALEQFSNLHRLVDIIETRDAAKRAVALKDRFTFKTEMDDEARHNMFRHIDN